MVDGDRGSLVRRGVGDRFRRRYRGLGKYLRCIPTTAPTAVGLSWATIRRRYRGWIAGYHRDWFGYRGWFAEFFEGECAEGDHESAREDGGGGFQAEGLAGEVDGCAEG